MQNVTPLWHKLLKIASASGAPPQSPLGELTTLPRPPSREGLLDFGNRSFAPSALDLSLNFSRSVAPKVIYKLSPLNVSRLSELMYK